MSISWSPPREGWFKHNTDGASKRILGKVAAGGLIRDHLGHWVMGFCKNIGVTSSVASEIWALRDGIKLALDKNLSNLEIETYAILLEQLIASGTMDSHQLNTSPTINHIYGEANTCADLLANIWATVENFQIFVNPPLPICTQLFDDTRDVCYPKLM
ncbi:hypothetical protein CsSME_00045259 [Camellia sinensis var. sinensis]